MFKYKRGIPLSYNRQGFIYFQSKLYDTLSPDDQEKIRRLCQRSAGQHWRALLEFVTTDVNATYVETHYYISRAQLYRYVKTYYLGFPEKL